MRYISIAILLFYSFLLQAQSPGGVTGVESWFKTVPVDNNNLQGSYRWQDFGGNGVKLTTYVLQDLFTSAGTSEYLVTRPSLRGLNFNEALFMPKTVQLKLFLDRSVLPQSSILGIFVPTSASKNDFTLFDKEYPLYGLVGRKTEGRLVSNDKIYHLYNNVPASEVFSSFDYGNTIGRDLRYILGIDSESSAALYRERSARLLTYMYQMQPNYDIWGEREQATFLFGKDMSTALAPKYPTGLPATTMSIFNGYIPEFIVYNRLLEPIERSKVESYLAIKYGLTLFDRSYLSSNGDLLWDLAANKDYNNRVTAYGKDKASGLLQRMSATTYEETTFSDLNDSNYKIGTSFTSQSAATKLVTIGLEKGNPIDDVKYAIWGDNNQPIAISSTQETVLGGIRMMPRRWKMRTNMAVPVPQSLTWVNSDISVVGDNYMSTVTKLASSVQPVGSIITGTSVDKESGYFSFVLPATALASTTIINVKLGTQQATLGAGDYGYQLRGNSLYTITNGVVGTTAIPAPATAKIEIEKINTTLHLKINNLPPAAGAGIVTIPPTDTANKYGCLSITKSAANVVLTKFIHGGFVNTGSEVELSYATNKATSFSTHVNDGLSYLLIDRTGTGNFGTPVSIIPSNESDTDRNKIIFNNVFWDTDGNKEDVFTFGYRTASFVAIINKINPTCSSTTPKSPLNDGKINIEVKEGVRGFYYKLINSATNTVVKEGNSYKYVFDPITGLAAGNYTLTLKELGDFTFTGTTSNAKAVSNQTITTTGTLEMIYTDTATDAYLGFSKSNILTSAAAFYGIYIKNNQLYNIVGGVTQPTALKTLVVGDKIIIERTATGVNYKVQASGASIATLLKTDALTDATAVYAYTMLNSKELLNVKGSGFNATPLTWNLSTGITVESPKSLAGLTSTITENITLTNPDCSTPTPPVITPIISPLMILKNSTIQTEFTARLTLDKDKISDANFLVYDMAGHLLQQQYVANPSTYHEVTFKNLQTGVLYIVKAITNTAEYSEKVQL